MTYIDQSRGGAEFVSYARNLMAENGFVVGAARSAEDCPRTPQRVKQVLKAAIVGGTTDPNWARELVDYGQMAGGFLESLRQTSVFDRLVNDGMRRMPLRTRIIAVRSGIEADEIGEGQPVPVSSLEMDTQGIPERKAATLIVMAKELTRAGVPGTEAFLASEIRRGVSASTDAIFLKDILADAPDQAATGTGAAGVRAAARWLLSQIATSATSRLFWIGSADTAKALAVMETADGATAFPGMTPAGGELLGVTYLVSDHADEGELVLIDADGIGGNVDTVTLSASEHALLSLGDTPPATMGDLTSLFQKNLVALKALRWFGFEKLRPVGVAAKVTGLVLE